MGFCFPDLKYKIFQLYPTYCWDYQVQLSYTLNNYMIIPEIPLCVWGC